MCVLCNQMDNPELKKRDETVGRFNFDLSKYVSDIEKEPSKQPRQFINLKHNLAKHEQESEIHLKLKERSALEKKESDIRQSRNEKIGLNLFNLRYTGIMHFKSYRNFEEDVLTANLNGTDTGDINNGRHFAKALTECIVSVMKEQIAQNISQPLDATGLKRPVGMVCDKITPNKRTGHITALILPVPENPLSQSFLVPVMLELPPVLDHTADGLASQMLTLFHNAGAEDSQLEGIGVDGQYIKLGAVKKLISKLAIDGYTEEQCQRWIFQIWEPAHNLNKAEEEIRNLPIFQWLDTFINEVGEITKILSIGKGLEQVMQAANELNMVLYKLQTYSTTRFAA